MMDLISNVIKSFIILFVVLEPFLSLAAFINLSKGMNKRDLHKNALIAVAVAFALIVAANFFGLTLLSVLGIDLSSFMVGGGIILLIMGIQIVFGKELSKAKGNFKAAAVVIGTPLLSGPGTITTVILLSQSHGHLVPLLASVVAIAIVYLMLFFSKPIANRLGPRLVEIFSRVLGLVLAALAVQIIRDGIIGMINVV